MYISLSVSLSRRHLRKVLSVHVDRDMHYLQHSCNTNKTFVLFSVEYMLNAQTLSVTKYLNVFCRKIPKRPAVFKHFINHYEAPVTVRVTVNDINGQFPSRLSVMGEVERVLSSTLSMPAGQNRQARK